MNALLQELRTIRDFDAEWYIKQKIFQINDFFNENNLDADVLGISGGVDSATTLALLMKAANEELSPIKRVFAVSMPIFSNGTTGQIDSINFALKDIEKYKQNKKFKFKVDDLSLATSAFLSNKNAEVNAFSTGQLASIVRTPNLYLNAAILQTEGYKSLVCGTTNRDEGYFIGFYGKASDAMVDIQPIFDIHKSEVYKVAKKLNVIEEIVERDPKGDVYDGRNDFEMIGASYDAVELTTLCQDYDYYIYQETNGGTLLNLMMDFNKTEEYKNILKLHHINSHKYKVGVPFHILNVMDQQNRFEG